MDHWTWIFLLLVLIRLSVIAAETSSLDSGPLTALMQDLKNIPPNWVGRDPCGSNWTGIVCTNSRVTSIMLNSMGLIGQLSGDVGSLTELTTLDLSNNGELKGDLPSSIGSLTKLTNLILLGCSFSGTIPDAIGSLQQLVFLSLNSNRLSGQIPSSIGKLSNIYWLDLGDNLLEGSIPVSTQSTPGLDLLVKAKHFHFGNNRLSGEIPPELFSSNMNLIHVLFENNELNGSIPNTLGSVKSLELIRFDRNNLSGSLPSNLNNLTNLSELYLSNNSLTGPIPDLTDMNQLSTVDLSNNTFDKSDFPTWLPTLTSLATLRMENTGLQGPVPANLFSLSNLQTVLLSNNNLNGTLDLGTSHGSELELIDIHHNNITNVTLGGYTSTLILDDNPVCQEPQTNGNHYCTAAPPNSSDYYTTPLNNCLPVSCMNKILSPNCKCVFPYVATLSFIAPSFSNLGNTTYFVSLQNDLMEAFSSNYIPVDSVSVFRTFKDYYLEINIAVFPSGDNVRFDRTSCSRIGHLLSNQTSFKIPNFGIYSLHNITCQYNASTKSSKVSSGIIIGAVVGGSVLLVLLVLAGLYAFRQKRRAERATQMQDPFAQWDPNKNNGEAPQIKEARRISFQELKKCTNSFSQVNEVGSGGYGKVYRATLPTGQLVAIKRAQTGSMQGGHEFKTEIELLSRLHHKNLVSLVGFCFEQGEQMLVYEYVPNGNLRDVLSAKVGIRLDWMRRLEISLGAARGLLYLHELADPPIIHRDIKSNNILLDEHLNPKVADFGLSKPMADADSDHVSTQVKGTLGYMDPEYYMTHQLTEKSDVYSFGVVMLELITAKKPIEHGKYIVREVRAEMHKMKDGYNLQEIIDPAINWESLQGLEKFVDLAMRCLQEAGADRPTMGKVVNEIENIMQFAGLKPDAGSVSTTASYEEASKGNSHHNPYNNDEFSYSGAFPSL